mmetsp:Transcript_99283/g.309381  ORF Transcript_99283/g.309381 Transcript_99283/m.309381 type:complete len:222 (-) Transcript_99283:99-764(-)
MAVVRRPAHLRREEGVGAFCPANDEVWLHIYGNTKVAYLHAAVRVDQQVLRLHVSVRDRQAVQVTQAAQSVAKIRCCQHLRHQAVGRRSCTEQTALGIPVHGGTTGRILYNEVELPVVLSLVKHGIQANAILMRDSLHQQDLAADLVQGRADPHGAGGLILDELPLLPKHALPEDLHGKPFSAAFLLAQLDVSKGAAPQLLVDAIAIDDLGAVRQVHLVDA